MFKPRERYNAKARGSVAGGKKKGKRPHSAVESGAPETDPNTAMMVPRTKAEKDAERIERLRHEVAPPDAKLTSKKKKRLDKYIEKKLKQEERVNILKKLEQSQAEVQTSALHSTSTLGTGRTRTHIDRLAQEEHKDVEKALSGRTGKRSRRTTQPSADIDSSESDADFVSEDKATLDGPSSHSFILPPRVMEVVKTALLPPAPTVASTTAAVGSALRRNVDGSIATPRVVKRKDKGQKTAFQSWNSQKRGALPSEESDTSFDSSDSAKDTPSEIEKEGSEDSHSEEGSASAESGEEGSSSEHGQPTDDETPAVRKPAKRRLRKPGAFKAWAMQQLSVSKQYVAPSTPTNSEPLNSNIPSVVTPAASGPPPTKRRRTEHASDGRLHGPLGETLVLPNTALADQIQRQPQVLTSSADKKREKTILVARSEEIVEARLQLPVVAEEQPIMEAIMLNPVVVICGETGSGKTTQVPQFLYEAGFGSPDSANPGIIGVTQPRRVAAMSMASRVAHELALPESKVSYQIRYDATISPSTVIKFMTDGVLLRELATDFLLNKYSVIIIDEAHERSLNTDILIGVLSRVVRLREEMWKEGKDNAKPLRLIIMSATLRVSDFAENKTLFPNPPPVLNVTARQHPVTVHFSRRTSSDYVGEAVRKAAKIHARLPPGGILIFLTGQNEIHGVCRKLEEKYGPKALEDKRKRRSGHKARTGPSFQSGQQDHPNDDERGVDVSAAQADVEPEDYTLGVTDRQDQAFDVDEAMDEADDNEALDSEAEGLENEALGIDTEESDCPMHIVPLYSLLPSEKQMRVFDPPPEGARLVVVSTNVAETSLTIPGIRYVIDSGRAKERRYDTLNGIQAFQVSWISKASAAQRAGRAGRTGPGHCYRLYSSALYENYFEQFAQPELLRVPIDGVVLQMKSMHIDAVANFPFPSPPDRGALRKAETVLTHLSALGATETVKTNQGDLLGGKITELGRAMSLFPVSPRFSRMLVSGKQQQCLPYVIAIVSALSVGDPFLREEALQGDEEENDSDGDLAHLTSGLAKVKEARKLRRKAFFQSQHTHSSLGNFTSDVFRALSVVGAYEYAGGGQQFCQEHFVRPKAMEEIHKLRAQISNITQANFSTTIVLSAAFTPPTELQLKVLRQLLAAAFIDQVAVRKDLTPEGAESGTKYASSSGVAYQAINIDEDVYIHPSSVLFNQAPPDYIVFTDVVRTTRVWLKGLTIINPAWLSALGKGTLCTFTKPVKTKEGKEIVIPRFGPGWELPPIPAERAKY